MAEKSKEEELDPDNAMRINPLQLVDAIYSEKVHYSGLMYLKIDIGGSELLVVVNSGVTKNFITEKDYESSQISSEPKH